MRLQRNKPHRTDLYGIENNKKMIEGSRMKQKIKRSLLYPKKSRRLKRRLLLFVYRLFPVLLFFMAAGVILFTLFLLHGREKLPRIPSCVDETEEFRSMQLKQEVVECMEMLSSQTDDNEYKILAVLMAAAGFYHNSDKNKPELPCTPQEYDALAEYYETHQKEELSLLEEAYKTLLSDLVCFPVMKSSRQEGFGITYGESWLAERSYQNASHSHEGTDIMALNNKRGYYPIVSMTDGVVEKLGWLEKGGYRVGIRSPHGAYLYYAHLYRYADGLKEGDTVRAGQLLGFMGDSGYSKVEGTVGNFDVHLHLGIYLKTEHYDELSVNPYWILRLTEMQTVIGDY